MVRAGQAQTGQAALPAASTLEPVSSTSQVEPFPNRVLADIVTAIDEAPPGQFTAGGEGRGRKAPAGGSPKSGGKVNAYTLLGWSRDDKPMPLLARGQAIPDDPPSDEEVWSKVSSPPSCIPGVRDVQRNDVRIAIEKICDKADPVRDYPLVGLCQLVHRHYKCTVFFSEHVWEDSSHTVKHKVEVIYITKDYLRGAKSGGSSVAPAGTTVAPAKPDASDSHEVRIAELMRLKRVYAQTLANMKKHIRHFNADPSVKRMAGLLDDVLNELEELSSFRKERLSTPTEMILEQHNQEIETNREEHEKLLADMRKSGGSSGAPAGTTVAPAKPDASDSHEVRIDRIVREVERLSRELESRRVDEDHVLDRLIEELKRLKTRDVNDRELRPRVD